MEININNKIIHFFAGDSIDLGKDGVITWLKDGYAEAWRLERNEAIKQTNETIVFLRNKLKYI